MRVNIIYYLTATLLGGLHALEPGHGKTVVAAYLIGSRGRKIDAVLLGLVVTLTHTFSVILLAVAAKLASTKITLTEESLHGYLGIVAGMLILVVGIWMLVGRIRGREPLHFHSHSHGHGHSHNHNFHLEGSPHSHDHSHTEAHVHDHGHTYNQDHIHGHNSIHRHTNPGHHSHNDYDHGQLSDLEYHHGLHNHTHEHGHDLPHTHSHDHSDDHNRAHNHEHRNDLQLEEAHKEKRVGFWQLFVLGVSGGLVPCPAAIAILLAAVGAGRLGEGLTYILLFSMGLATVLIAIGIVVVSAGKLASRFLDAKRFARKVSIASAAIITLIGGATFLNSIRHLI